MKIHITRRFLPALALACTLAFVAACSGTSPSMNPTSPSSLSAASGANFSPNPDPPPPPPTGIGRFTGGGFQITGAGVKVTRGFTIHCDNRLTNNFEVNWGGGNNFHIDKNTLTGTVCTLEEDPAPPAAPVSRITASASGTCNGGTATITFTLEDHGEPGTEDRAAISITGACSLTVPLSNIDGGNIQAHFDQPHKDD